MLHCSWDVMRDGCNCFSFWAIFCPNSQKNKNFKKMKKQPGNIIILHKCTKNYDQMMYDSWDMVRDGCNCYFSFWAIFCTFTPLTSQKINILKKWNKHLEISPFYISLPKVMTRWCTVPEICCATDGWTDGRTEKVTYKVGAPPKNLFSFHSRLAKVINK